MIVFLLVILVLVMIVPHMGITYTRTDWPPAGNDDDDGGERDVNNQPDSAERR